MAAAAAISLPATAASTGGAGGLLKRADLIFTTAIFGTVLLLIMPVPPFVLDLLLALSLGTSLLVLLVIIYVKDPPEFSGFPTVLLAFTLFRLALNIGSTRQILLHGYAGHIIESFGHFVIQGNYIVGAVVFIILVVINFVVITKGAGRIAEVAARFTLDAMPGKQMAIDAELNAGIIDEVTATARRLKIQKEADFYGAMDGASKFVRGDAVAGILITLVNVVGGFAIGVLQMDLTLSESLQKFTLLSIGDGLISQIPALIVSVAAGILVTRASENSNLGTQIGRQILRYPRAIGITGVMLAIFGLMPGMPTIPFLALALVAGYVARTLKNEPVAEPVVAPAATGGGRGKGKGGAAAAAPATARDDFRKLIELDLFAIEIGHGLLSLADAARGGDLLSRVTGVRKTLAREKGILVPSISVRDNLELEPNDYRFLLRGKMVGRGSLMPGRWMAMNVTGSQVKLRGTPTREPVFNLEATWIAEDEKKIAELNGHTIVEPSSVLVTHLSETLKACAWHLLARQDVQTLIDHVKETHPALIAELLPDLVNLGLIQRVLQNLLRESISIINLPLILEGIADFAPVSKNPDDLSEIVRRRLGLYFVTEYECRPGAIKALTLDPRLEQHLTTKIHRSPSDYGLALDPVTARTLLEEINRRGADTVQQGLPLVLVVAAEIRLPLKRFLETSLPRLIVLSYPELPPTIELESIGFIPCPPNLALARPEPVLKAA
jgi:flagellar biosynthesis protein FlhA